MNKSLVAKKLVDLAKNLLAAEARTINRKEREEYENLVRQFDEELSKLGFNGDWNKDYNKGSNNAFNINVSQISTPSASATSKSSSYSFKITSTAGQGGHGGRVLKKKEFNCETVDKLKSKLDDAIHLLKNI